MTLPGYVTRGNDQVLFVKEARWGTWTGMDGRGKFRLHREFRWHDKILTNKLQSSRCIEVTPLNFGGVNC
jgi:hypothetical protein